MPIDISDKEDVVEERERSLVDDTGINARDLVKLFRIKPQRGMRKTRRYPQEGSERCQLWNKEK